MNKVLSGEPPAMPEMLASRLVALQKCKGGVRPIAVGEVWTRFCCLCALELCSEASIALAPLQLGVGVAGVHKASAMHCELVPKLTWTMSLLQQMSGTH